ncbi:hypothetical protein [Hydrogenimonas sp.]
MNQFLRHMIRGMQNSLVVGSPGFSRNNRYADMINIGHDFRTSIGRMDLPEKESTTGSCKNKASKKARSMNQPATSFCDHTERFD